ncbi:unnamed protein product [Adineta steineri]|uniref:Uncharacterized protein n=1 Tax=Adineta steineri TaxID=433720 RepID=A0A820NLM4_9BILA|nr:unnamed protein product [Adineta steineri]CAF4390689.1 unnamed protein product [Adineta steineri]
MPISYSIHYPIKDIFSDFVPQEINKIIFNVKNTCSILCLPVSLQCFLDHAFFMILKDFLFSIVRVLFFIVMIPIYLLYSLCGSNQVVSMINLCSIVGVGISLSTFIYGLIK